MSVLVTGAGGFCGSQIVTALLGAGYRVVAMAGRNSYGRLGLGRRSIPALTVLLGDLANDISLPEGIETVVHTAAVSPGPGVHASADDFIRNNTEATRRLVQWARKKGVQNFVYFSSVSVFGRITVPVLDESYPRIDPGAYGVSKWMGELVLGEQGDAMTSLSLRLPGVIGRGAVRNWLASLVEAAKDGREIPYFHGNADYNNAVHIEDLCQFVVDLLSRGMNGHEMVTLAAAESMKVRDMVTKIASGFKGRSALREVPPTRPAFTISIARAQKLFDYNPMTMRQMIARFVEENKA